MATARLIILGRLTSYNLAVYMSINCSFVLIIDGVVFNINLKPNKMKSDKVQNLRCIYTCFESCGSVVFLVRVLCC